MADQFGIGTGIEEETREDVKEPSMYRVVLHNDHYTTMEFVVEVLTGIFHKTPDEAVRIMLDVHHNEIGQCGVYPREVAETKVASVHAAAEANGFPLRSSMEPE